MEPKSRDRNELKLLYLLTNYQDLLPVIVNKAKPEWFTSQDMATAYNFALGLYKQNQPVTTDTLKVLYDNAGLYTDIENSIVESNAVEVILQVMWDNYTKRQALKFVDGVSKRLQSHANYGISEIQRDIDLFMKSAIFRDNMHEAVLVHDVLDGYRDSLVSSAYQANLNVNSSNGINTPIIAVNNLIGAFMPGELVVIAGRPSMGKSLFALEIAAFNALQYKKMGLFASLEMPRETVLMRLISRYCGINLLSLKRESLVEADYKKIFEPVICKDCKSTSIVISKMDIPNNVVRYTCMKCSSSNIINKSDMIKNISLLVDDNGNIGIIDMERKLHYYKNKYPSLGYVIVDYLQLMKFSKAESKNDAVGEACRMFKNIARDLGLVMIIVAQLNRESEKRADKRPILSDLRDSGEIEAHADAVLFIHREHMYTKLEEDRYHGEIIIAKQRNGPIGIVPIGVDLNVQRFYDVGGEVLSP